MEQLNQFLKTMELQTEKRQGHKNFLPSLLQNNEEKKAVELKYASPQIGSMAVEVLNIEVAKLLLKIHIITGWTLPTGIMLSALQELFEKKLLLDYDNFNVDEIEYAFLKFGTTTEDWGKEFNLNLTDKILIPYLAQRLEFSKNEERKKEEPIQKIYTDEEILNQRRGDIETGFQAMKNGRNFFKYIEIPVYWKEVLLQDGLMDEEETIEDFLVKALATKQKLYKK